MKILCLGNNTEDTDRLTTVLAKHNGSECRGLLTTVDENCLNHNHTGYYHTTVVDIDYGQLLRLAKEFDQLVVLNQPKESYNHPDFFYKTVRIATELEQSMLVEWQNSDMKKSINFFNELIQTNKAFCIFPFIELLTNNDYTTVCCRSTTPVTYVNELTNFGTDKNYQTIRQNMIDGVLIPQHCDTCYSVEKIGMISARQQETVEWANRLNLTSLDDLQKISKPVYYEVRPSNKCNLQCRMCGPSSSELINQEYFKLKIIDKLVDLAYSGFDIVDLESVKKLYVAGGEPTAMPEFFDFLDRCIDHRSNFEFTVNTNANKFSDRFKRQLQKLPHVQFIVSIDGYQDLNHYIRWPSNWNSIVENVKYLCENQHVVSFNVTVSMYNVSELHNLLSFFDQEFPGTLIHAQLAGGITSPLNFPNSDLVLEDLQKATTLQCYQNDWLLKNFIDSLITHFQTANATVDLEPFLRFNSKLDANRNISMKQHAKKLWQAIQSSQPK